MSGATDGKPIIARLIVFGEVSDRGVIPDYQPLAWTVTGAMPHTSPMRQVTPVLVTIGFLWSAAVIAPGPNFLITARTSLLNSRAAGIRTALGISCGAIVWGLDGFLGVHALLTLAPWLYAGLKLGGSAYLILLGIKFCRDSFHDRTASYDHAPTTLHSSAVWRGFLISIANPQTSLSTASLFAATLPEQPPLALGVGAIAILAMIALVWYGFVASALTLRPAAAMFARCHHWIDRIAGVAFIGLGTKLAFDR
jgi:threonine/homoserine/homoserine lactone efflux protein